MGSPDEYGNPPAPYTGRVVLRDDATEREGAIYMRHGYTYAVSLTGFVPPLATRLHSGGLLTDEQCEYLLTLPPEQVGPEAVARGYTTAEAVEDVNRQMMLSSVTHLYGWKTAPWWWEEDVSTDDFTIRGLETGLLVSAADERVGQWDALSRNYPQVTKSHAIPIVGPEWSVKEGQQTTPEMAAILRRVDGETSIARIANDCGFTRFEIAARLAKALADAVIEIPDPDRVAGSADETFTAGDPRYTAYQEAYARVQYAQQLLDTALAELAAIERDLPAAPHA